MVSKAPAAIPATMTAVEITRPGGPDVLAPARRPVPKPGPGEILIRVAAAGVNRPDVMQRRGEYPPPPGVTDIPGLEVAGTVAALGEGATRWAVGDAVTALVPGGGYAQYCVAHELHALPVPAGMSMREAAGLPETFFTVWHNVFERGRLAAGESILIHGGASGIGTTAIQLAGARGATVFTTVGSAEKAARVVALGARHAINYRTEDFVAAIRTVTGGAGVDVILDMIGGDYVDRNLQIIKPEGRLVQIAAQSGGTVSLNIWNIISKRAVFTGSTLRPRTTEEKGRIAQALRDNVWPLLEAGTVRPVIDRSFPLEAAAQAHARMDASAHVGKIMLDVG